MIERQPEEHKYLYLREDIHPPVYMPGTGNDGYKRQVSIWYRSLNPEQMVLYSILQAETFGLLGITSFDQLQALIEHPQNRKAASVQFSRQMGMIYGVKGRERIKQKCDDFGACANTVRDNLQLALSYSGSPNLEMTNEIRAKNNPIDLLLIALDGSWPSRARWDAKVKLQFMSLAAAIDRRQREIGIESQFERFVGWMREWVWAAGSDDFPGVYLVSTHDPDTWACTGTHWVGEEEGVGLELPPFHKKNHLIRRSIRTDADKQVDVYVTTRDKPLVNKVEKMFRKKAEDPVIAVDDDTGLMAVINNISHIRYFISHLASRGYQSNYPIIIEAISNTLDGRRYEGNHGSSPDLRMLKFFVRLANEMRIEFIIHTPETYAESLTRKGVSHYEYMQNRLYESGVPDMVFKKKYFPLFDSAEARRQKLMQIRRGIEGN